MTHGGNRTGTGARANRRNIFRWEDDSSAGVQNQSFDFKTYVVRAQEHIETELTPSEYHREFIYSHLLEDILTLAKNSLNDKGNWRQQEQQIMNLAKQLKRFNAVEVHEYFGALMLEQLRTGCD